MALLDEQQAAILTMIDFSGDDIEPISSSVEPVTIPETIIFNPQGTTGGEIIWDPNGEPPPVNINDFFITPSTTPVEQTGAQRLKSY